MLENAAKLRGCITPDFQSGKMFLCGQKHILLYKTTNANINKNPPPPKGKQKYFCRLLELGRKDTI